jgi:alpha-glucosidase
VYYGEELGMGCQRIPKAALRDPLGVRTWPFGFLGRDPERTPMQWDASANAGFTSGRPWLPLNRDYVSRNVAAEAADPDSTLSLYKRLLALRKSRVSLREGELAFLDGADRDVLAYLRGAGEERSLVLLNFASRPARFSLAGPAFAGGEILLSTDTARGLGELGAEVELAPCEGLICDLR